MSDFREQRVQIIDAIRDLFTPMWQTRIAGIEVTQSIQHYRAAAHLTDPADRGPDNSVYLVAHKPAIVRVYVRGTGEAVGGRLRVERLTPAMTYREVDAFEPWDAASIVPHDTDDYAVDRVRLSRTLNFRIPAVAVAGTMRITAEVGMLQRSVHVEARLIQTLRVRVIPVHYHGPSTSAAPAPGSPRVRELDLAAPTLADMQTTAAEALATMPVQQTGSFAPAGSLNWFTALDDAPANNGACSGNWNSLLTWLGLVRDNDGNRSDVVYYGLLPAGMPLGMIVGCGSAGLGAGVAGDTSTFLHEIGHAYGFAHAPCGGVGRSDPDYPRYEPYSSGSIGEYGTDVRNGDIHTPATTGDYMGYCRPRWMSLYHHRLLHQHPRLTPTWVREHSPFDRVPVPYSHEHLWWPTPPWREDGLIEPAHSPVISVRGFVDEAGDVRVDSVARITASPVMQGPRTAWSVQLIGAEGTVAARTRLARVESHSGCCGCADDSEGDRDPNRRPFRFHALLPDLEPGTAVRIVTPEGEDAWTRHRPERETGFGRATARVADDSLHVGWTLEGAPDDTDVWAQYSNDGGETWHGLAVGLRDGAADLPTAGLAAGPVQLRLLAHDGFSTAISRTVKAEIPRLPSHPAILYPVDGARLHATVPVEATGSAVDQAGFPIEDERLAWLLDGAVVGRGRAATLRAIPGRHDLQLVVDDDDGRAKVTFEVMDDDRPA